jgi:hypothetical protein
MDDLEPECNLRPCAFVIVGCFFVDVQPTNHRP